MEKELQPDKASLLSQWKNRKDSSTGPVKITKAPEGVLLPLSHGQKRLWFLQQLYPENPFYNYSESYVFKGVLYIENLLRSLELVCEKHEILRSTYYMKEGQAFMQVAPKAQIEVSRHDFSDKSSEDANTAAQALMRSQARYAFDLSKHPMVLCSVIKMHDTKHIILLTLHHISTDEWSMEVLRTDLAAHYVALCAGNEVTIDKPEIQFSDFTYWQSNQQVDKDAMTYWKTKLSGKIPYLNLPTDYQRPSQPSFKGNTSKPQVFSKEVSAAILNLAKELEVTPYVLLLSVFYVLLHRYGGQRDILIGSPIANRDQKELEKLIGFFIDTIVLRTSLEPKASFKELVASVKQTSLEAFSNKNVPFDVLVKELKLERSLTVNPFFQVMFFYGEEKELPSFGQGLELTNQVYEAGVSKFDLTLYVSQKAGQLISTFEYSTDLFKDATINQFQKHFGLLLEGIIENTGIAISDIPMFTHTENSFFFEQKTEQTAVFESYSGIHEIIEGVCQATPDKIALTFGHTSLSYGQLEQRATVLASRILETTLGENKIVGLLAERSLDMIVGLYAILKAGCAYLPLDAKYPEQRLDFMLKDADVAVVVTQNALVSRFENFDLKTLVIDSNKESDSETSVRFPKADRNNLAYMIYTSGSTGRPKGVPITHGNIINSTEGRLEFYPKNPTAFLLMSSISFDSSKAGIFWTLCTGGNLVITEDRVEQDIHQLSELIHENNVSHTLMLPSLYGLLLEYGDISKLQSLNTIMVAGEACSSKLCGTHFDKLSKTALYNEYGPTEATVWCIAHKIEPKDALGGVPLGKPVANAEIYLLNEHRHIVPVGAVGEIYVGGKGLASRYYKRPDLSDKAYVPNPFGKGSDEKLYKTGDLARYNSEGNIEFLGRSDQQIKIRGYRVELNEIEKVLEKESLIEEAIVLAEDANGMKRLSAFVISNSQVDVAALTKIVKDKLPEYMVPSSISQVDEFPKLPNGKINKKALEGLKQVVTSEESEKVQEPSTELEFKLLDLWKELLQLDSIGVNDNFFHLGGDSILSIQFIAKARKAGIAITPNQIFDNQTISELADFITQNEKQTEQWDYLVALRKEGSKKPIFCIHAGGGHVFFYNVLTKYIDADRPIYALQASGFYGDKAMHNSIEEMARDYITAIRSVQTEGPYNVMVYCFSVSVGQEILLQLKKQGLSTNLIVMDTMTDPWRLNTPERLKMRVKGFAKRLLLQPVKTIKTMVGQRLLQVKLLMNKKVGSKEDRTIAKVNANLAKICMEYQWVPHNEKVTLLLTEKVDENINKMVVDSWKKVALGGVEVTTTKGDHINLFTEPDVAFVAKKLEESCL